MANTLKTHPVRTDFNHWFTSYIRRWPLFLAALACFLGPASVALRAQSEDYDQDVGVPAYTAELPVENGFINAANGDLHLEIPLGSWPQRGGRPFKAELVYDSNIWADLESPYNVPDPWGRSERTSPYVMAGWRLVTSAFTGAVNSAVWGDEDYCDGGNGTTAIATYSAWTWQEPNGTVHAFDAGSVEIDYPSECNSYEYNYYPPSTSGNALDASGYTIVITNGNPTVYAPDGTAVYSSDNYGFSSTSGVEDSNGNYYPLSGTASDSLGRTLITTTTSGDHIYYDVLNSTGGTSRYTVTTESMSVQKCYGTPTDFTLTAIQSIGLPDGTSYSFTYDSGTSCNYGLLNSMTLPTGSTIDYLFHNVIDATGNYVRVIESRTTPDGTWGYASTVDNSTCTSYLGIYLNCDAIFTVTEPSLDQEVYTFQVNGGAWPIEAQYYDYSSGNVIATITQAFDFSSGYCGSGWACSPYAGALRITQTSKTTTLPVPGGSVSATTEYAYDTSSTYGSLDYGNLMQKSDWNFGSNTSNPADRTTTYTYLNGSSYTSVGIVNRPANVTVANSSGSTVAQTLYCYDYASGCGGSSFTSAGTITNHDSAFGISYTTSLDYSLISVAKKERML